mgnify:CR=1 FL=1
MSNLESLQLADADERPVMQDLRDRTCKHMEAIVEERAPLHRHVSAEDVGAAAAYLLGDGARNVTGTTLYVDSGYHAMGM